LWLYPYTETEKFHHLRNYFLAIELRSAFTARHERRSRRCSYIANVVEKKINLKDIKCVL
ncbi:hypothetical protein, partial [Hydrocoleum sp. CS-953]|uniref:hypothetical protein n=2 Tax=Microcoleaceae TaxID=1892252 RepID=UPI001AEFB82E